MKDKITKEQKELFESFPMELYLFTNQALAASFDAILESKKRNFISALDLRISKEEKIDFTHEAIRAKRKNIETDILNNVYNFIAEHPEKFSGILAGSFHNPHHLGMAFFEGNELKGSKAFEILLSKCTSDGKTEGQIEIHIEELRKHEIVSPALENALRCKSSDLEELFLYPFFYLHFERLYLSYLIDTYNQLQGNGIIDDKHYEKIEWQGKQKELAELFIELQRKGWIKEIKPDLIQAYFTNSTTIKQVLKPAQDAKTKQNLYDSVFTKQYKAMFAEIKPNKTDQQ